MSWTESGARWFGVKFWRTWAVEGEVGHVEEAVYLVRGENEAEAEEAGWRAAHEDDSDFTNEHGQPVQIRVRKLDYVWDTKLGRLRSGAEVLGQVFELDDEGSIDLDLPLDDRS